jgi:thioesterase domain-containing protein
MLDRRPSRPPFAATPALAPAPAPGGRTLRRGGHVPTLVPVQRRGARPTIFWFCAGYGDILALAKLSRLLGPEQPVYCLQPGLRDRVTPSPAQLLDSLTTEYIAALRTVQPRGPYVLGGCSTGGLIALEVAQRLWRQGDPAGPLVLLDAPHAMARRNHILHRLVAGAARRVARRADSRAPAVARRIRVMLTDEGLSAHLHALDGYVARPYPGRISLFQARSRLFGFVVSAGLLGQTGRWRALAGGGFDVEVVPGNHISFLRPPHVAVLAQRIRAVLTGGPGTQQRELSNGRHDLYAGSAAPTW